MQKYVDRVGSANKASKILGISSSYVSQMLNRKWDAIADETWRKVESQVSGKAGMHWNMAETANYKSLMTLYKDAQDFQQVYGVVVDAGSSKSFTAERYALENDNVIWLECADFWNQRQFLKEILRAMGKKTGAYHVGDLMAMIIEEMYTMEKPLLIIDEADKLNDNVLYFFITIYNQLKGNCAIVLQATNFLRIRIDKGVEREKKGYKEIMSRLGGKFIRLPDPTKADITKVCEANGVFDELEITRIINDSKGDLRRVQRMVHAYARKQALQQKQGGANV